MASTWWEPDQNPLISMNPTRMEFIRKTLQTNNKLQKSSTSHNSHSYSYQPLIGLKALDVGCGGGLLSESLARLGSKVTAVDPSEQVANAAYEHSQLDPSISNSIDYRGGTSVEDLAKEVQIQIQTKKESEESSNDLLFDVICILEVIEHATDPNSLIQSATSLLKKPTAENPNDGGILFVSTINRTAKSYAIAIVGGEYVTQKLPVGTHNWEQFKSPQEIHSLVGEYGLREVDMSGMVLKPPFYDLRWELDGSDVDVNWIGAYSHHSS
jgi:ubiquinone biosynthesis O-methyltransferase